MKHIIVTSAYDHRGGVKTMVENFIAKKALKDYRIYAPVNRRYVNKERNVSVIKIGFLHSINFFQQLLGILLILRKTGLKEKVNIITGTPLMAFPLIFLPVKANCWFATSLPDELMSQRNSVYGIKARLFSVIELLLLPFYFILENIALLNGKIKFYALSDSTKSKLLFNRRVSVLKFAIEEIWKDKKCKREKGTVISVARYTDPRKDFNTLLKTAALLPEYKFKIIGPVPMYEKNKYPNIESLGTLERNKLVGYLNKADVFYLPSIQEGLGIVYLEAQACGLPVVTMKNGGAQEIITHGLNGYLCDKRDYKIAVEYIKDLVSDRSKRDEFARNAKEYIDSLKQKTSMRWEKVEMF